MTQPKIGIIISSTRKGRLGARIAQWVRDLGQERPDLAFEIVDLRDYPLDFFDAEMSPRFAPVEGAMAQAWASKVAGLDGYVFVTAEYNRSITGALKNALDYLYAEPLRKPASFVGYGAVGGARAVEQLRLMAVELGMVVTKSGVHVGMEPMIGLMRDGKDFADFPHLAPTVVTMLDELAWFATTLKAARAQEAHKVAA
jgi:NAD(P)H-dependent FMN reductase